MDENHDREAEEGLGEALWREATSLERVLVVSSSMHVRVALSDALEELGYRIRAASSAEAARRVVRAELPDVAVVDLVADDAEALREAGTIRATAYPHRLPVLAICADPVSEIALRSHGIDRAMRMPVRFEELVRAIQELTEPARTRSTVRPTRSGQIGMNLQDRMQPAHLLLGTPFPARVTFELIPQNDPYIAELRAQLARMALADETEVRGGELVISFHPTIAEAFNLGINRWARDELFFALVDGYPELGRDPEALRRRILELEDEYMRLQRRAS